MSIAGRLYRAEFAPAPHLTYTVTWDGKDAYGRPLQGAQTAVVQVHFDYYTGSTMPLTQRLCKQLWPGAEAAGSCDIGLPRGRAQITLSRTWTEECALLGNAHSPSDLGGWSLSVQHAYDPAAQIAVVWAMAGSAAPSALTPIITTVAGNGMPWLQRRRRAGNRRPGLRPPRRCRGTGRQPVHRGYEATPHPPRGAGWHITTVAGNGASGFSGDGGPAMSGKFA